MPKWFRYTLIALAAVYIGGSAAAQNTNATAAVPNYNTVTDARLLHPSSNNWLIYKGSYSEQAFSGLDQITPLNVGNLVPVWAYSTGENGPHEAAPLINDGVMFATGAYDTLFALNATTGTLLWSYKRNLPQDVYPEVCCGVDNRGVALYGDKVYMATLDDHLVAFDATTGKIAWDKTVANYKDGYAMTVAPLAAKGKILVGVAGGEYGIRGFIQAFDAGTGDPLWKTYTTAAPDQPGGNTWPGDTYLHGGGSIWVTGSYDPTTNVTYWGTGNGWPDATGDVRPGDNLYVGSVIGLNLDTGNIVSHYQYNPNSTWDYDEISDQTLVTVNRNGQQIQGLIHAGRNGIFYLLNRGDNLKFVYGVPFSLSEETITGFTADGRPIVPANRRPAINKTISTCPGAIGANNWYGLSYDPQTGYAYVPTKENCMTITGQETVYQAGQHSFAGKVTWHLPPDYQSTGTGALQAINVATGKVVWRDNQKMPVISPVLSTKGGVVFMGDAYSRQFRAYDANTGRELWHFTTNSGVIGVPVSFSVNGVQYVAVESGIGGSNATLLMPTFSKLLGLPYTAAEGGVIWVFALKH